MPFLVALTIHLHFPDSGSLKGKRKELLSVRSALHRRFGASVAEVADQDLWQRATLAAALVSRSAGDVEHAADAIERYLYGRFPESVRVERRLVSFEDLDV
jgi:uncharacterized protein